MATRRTLLAWGGGVLAAGLLGAACGEPKAAVAPAPAQTPPGPVDGGIGQPIARPGVTVTVKRLNAPRGTFYVTLQIEVQSTGTAKPAIGAEATKLELPDGRSGKAELGGPGSELPGTGPEPGQSAVGWRTLGVPDGTRAATLVLTPFEGTVIRIGLTIPERVEDRTVDV